MLKETFRRTYTSMTESQIILGCQKRDKLAFKCLIDDYSSMLMGVCIRYMKNEFDAKDALQETFIRVFKSIDNIDINRNFKAWLRKIAVNECLKALIKTSKLNKNDLSIVDMEIQIDPAITSQISEEEIIRQINKLPDHYRVIFNMYEVEGFSHKEIAEMLNIQESTSRTKLTRAKQILKEVFFNFENINIQQNNSSIYKI